MKHLKIFETKDYTNKPKYNIGDYVETFPGEYSNKKTDIMRILDRIIIKHEGRNVYQYQVVLIDDEDEYDNNGDINCEYPTEDYIIRKLTPEEVKLYRATNKYNL